MFVFREKRLGGKNPPPITGLGDVVAVAIHKLTGIKPCAACERRRRWLNKIFPLRR